MQTLNYSQIPKGKEAQECHISKVLAELVPVFVINKTNHPLLCSAFCSFQNAFLSIIYHVILTVIPVGRQSRDHFSPFVDKDMDTW